MLTKKFTSEEVQLLKITGLARKYGCSAAYVTRILTGERERNTVLARKIIADAIDMLDIMHRETKITL